MQSKDTKKKHALTTSKAEKDLGVIESIVWALSMAISPEIYKEGYR